MITVIIIIIIIIIMAHNPSWYVVIAHIVNRFPTICHVTGWMIRGSKPGRANSCFSSPDRPDRVCGPPVFLLNWYRGYFPEQSVMLTTRRRLPPRLRMNGVIALFPQCTFMAWAGTTLIFMENKDSLSWAKQPNLLWSAWML